MAREESRMGAGSKEVGERVRGLRRGRSLSLRELSGRSGVSTDAIVKLEHGARPSRPSTVRKVAKALGVDPAYLLDGSAGVAAGALGGERQDEMMLAFAARGRAEAEGRDAVEVYRELRENPPSLEEILGGALPGDVAEGRARAAGGHLAGPDPRAKERVPESERDAAGEISEQRAGRLGS